MLLRIGTSARFVTVFGFDRAGQSSPPILKSHLHNINAFSFWRSIKIGRGDWLVLSLLRLPSRNSFSLQWMASFSGSSQLGRVRTAAWIRLVYVGPESLNPNPSES